MKKLRSVYILYPTLDYEMIRIKYYKVVASNKARQFSELCRETNYEI